MRTVWGALTICAPVGLGRANRYVSCQTLEQTTEPGFTAWAVCKQKTITGLGPNLYESISGRIAVSGY